MGLHKYVNRRRATTRAILGNHHVEDVTDAPNPLPVEKEASAYTEDRLKQALNFADLTLRNKN